MIAAVLANLKFVVIGLLGILAVAVMLYIHSWIENGKTAAAAAALQQQSAEANRAAALTILAHQDAEDNLRKQLSTAKTQANARIAAIIGGFHVEPSAVCPSLDDLGNGLRQLTTPNS